MDEDIAIINSKSRNEKIKNFFIKNKKIIVVSLISIIIIILSYFFYGELNKKKRNKLAGDFNSASINFTSKDNQNIKNEMIKIIEAKDTTYSPLALFFILDNNIIVPEKKINELFDVIIYETKLDKEIKNLIIYKKALFNSDFINENDLLKILNPLINSETIWKSHALYLLGEYFFSKNEKQKSKDFFEKILNLKNSNLNIKSKAQKRIQRDFSE
tara:strand:+ start:524 stop:1168 length:645 start_codon:yes stop_codon:yes gene_type:complete